MRIALDFSYIRKQPGSLMPEIEVTPPRSQKRQICVLTMAQQEQLIRYQKDTDACKFGVLLALLTGMRIGEVCALQWKDISLPDRVIHVRATMPRLQLQGAEKKTTVLHWSAEKPKRGTGYSDVSAGGAAMRSIHAGRAGGLYFDRVSELYGASFVAVPVCAVYTAMRVGTCQLSCASSHLCHPLHRGGL